MWRCWTVPRARLSATLGYEQGRQHSNHAKSYLLGRMTCILYKFSIAWRSLRTHSLLRRARLRRHPAAAAVSAVAAALVSTRRSVRPKRAAGDALPIVVAVTMALVVIMEAVDEVENYRPSPPDPRRRRLRQRES